jgi:biopolymer transport protein ExbB
MACTSIAHAQESDGASSAGTSFASAFFVSKVTNPDGTQSLDIFGSALLWLLLILSMTSLGFMCLLTLTNQRKSYVHDGVLNDVKKLMTAGKFREAVEITSADESFFSRCLNPALREASHGFSAVVRALEEASDEQSTQRLRKAEYLNILAQVSPMIGLFGTVWGMILAFHAIVVAGGNANPVLLAGGIGTALTTTFWGLLIAIPALAAYAIIRNRIDEFTTDATRVAEELLNEFRARSGGSAGEKSTSPKVHKSKGSVEHSSVAAEDAST